MSKGADKFFLKTNQFAATEAMDTSRQTALDDGYRQWVDKNLQEIVRGEFAYPGCIEFWRSAEPFFDDEVRELINRSLGQS